ncbi:hypothetical protein SB00610_02670 [Klebsiella quasipneumoniae subsp. similipneumoniae]|nr:hypothetical protein SB00610_02670 [Klebsiella quasipneumoniae subsp. similipneumoniae]
MLLKGFDRVFIKGGEKHNIGAVLRVEHPSHLQTADARHLDVEKQHVGTQLMYRANRLHRVAALADDLDIALCLQQYTQVFPRQRLIIDDQYSQHAFSSRGRRRVTRVKRSGSQVTLMPQSAPKRARSRLSTRFIPSPLA